MSTQQQARALMMRHYQQVKNRQESMLQRTASEIGMTDDATQHWHTIQGKIEPTARAMYDRSNASMS